ncbi:MAG: ferredoxin--NADP(+) reductase [Gemmatimonadota bacterium]|nr:MAG: ferredoxin--NADP(+) reductase [Gemmatimonadota bacterium]
MNETVTRLADVDTSARYHAAVLSSERITPPESNDEVRELVLSIDLPDFRFHVGQSIGVVAPGSPEFGKADHIRLYSVADLPHHLDDGTVRIKICVRRCSYVDSYSGEEYPGVASNYLCDRKVGDVITITDPIGVPFRIPENHDAHLILIGTGTGIAPFRAFVKHIYRTTPDWRGRILLFYGANSGLELLYMNEEIDDFAQYYDRETFEAFQALSPRPNWADPIAWDHAIGQRGDEIWKLMGQPGTHVYLAGLEKMRPELDRVFAALAGSEESWERRRAELAAGGRWVELLY